MDLMLILLTDLKYFADTHKTKQQYHKLNEHTILKNAVYDCGACINHGGTDDQHCDF
jgi:hypothetical protein